MSWAVHKYNLGPNSEAISLYWKQGDADDTVSGVTCHNHPGDAEELQKNKSIITEEKMSTSQSDNDGWNFKFFLLNWIGISSSIGRRLDRVHKVIIRIIKKPQLLF
jgi:hypothetical protein